MQRYFNNQDMYLRTVEYLSDKAINYNWDTNKMKPMDSELFINKEIQVGGTVPLLLGNATAERGVTNFDGNKLTKGRVFVCNGISFGVGFADSGTAVHSVNYGYGSGVPDFMKHANLVLKQKDEKIIDLPISALANSFSEDIGGYYRDLSALSLIEDETLIDLEIEFPQGVKVPDGTPAIFVSIYLRGLGTHLKR